MTQISQLAGEAVASTSQFAQDNGSNITKKCTAAQIRDYVQVNLEDAIAQTLQLTLDPFTAATPATYLGYNFTIFDNKSSVVNHHGAELGGFEVIETSDGDTFNTIFDVDGLGNGQFKGALQAAHKHVSVTAAAKNPNFSFLGGGDENSVQICNRATAQTITLPANTKAFPIGTWIDWIQIGAGKVTFQGDGTSTVSSRGGLLSISAQFGRVRAEKIATNTWLLSGDLGA